MTGHGKTHGRTRGHRLAAAGGLLVGLGAALAFGVAGLVPTPAEATPCPPRCGGGPPAVKMTPPTSRPNVPRINRPNVRDNTMAGKRRPDGADDVALTDAEKEELEIDRLLDELIWAIDPRQAAARSIMDEYLEAAARPENADKNPDELMEQATAKVMERLFPIDEDTRNQPVDPDDYDSPTHETVIETGREMATKVIIGKMRQGDSPVLAGRPGNMSQQEWAAHLQDKETIYQERYDKDIKDKKTQRPQIRPLREANGDQFVMAARAAAAGLAPKNLSSKADRRTSSRRETVSTIEDPYGNRNRIEHNTRDTQVIIVNEGSREVGVKVDFKERGSYGGQQPVVYGADPTVPEKMIYYGWWADAFNTNEIRTFGKIQK